MQYAPMQVENNFLKSHFFTIFAIHYLRCFMGILFSWFRLGPSKIINWRVFQVRSIIQCSLVPQRSEDSYWLSPPIFHGIFFVGVGGSKYSNTMQLWNSRQNSTLFRNFARLRDSINWSIDCMVRAITVLSENLLTENHCLSALYRGNSYSWKIFYWPKG